jgi:hypothetical protein
MKIKSIIIVFMAIALFMGVTLLAIPTARAQSDSSTATPTYDPFAQPPLPDNPSQLELGRYLFWRYCMPCHGDLGQGLTDEFRLKWEPEHQNCWARGCHSGKYADDSFPVPTIVPPNVRPGLLDKYTPDSLFDFLRATHPPEDPGLLTDEEYRAVVAILYHMNDVPFPAQDVTAPPAPSETSTPPASLTPTLSGTPFTEADAPFGLWPIIGLAVILTVIVLLRQGREQN